VEKKGKSWHLVCYQFHRERRIYASEVLEQLTGANVSKLDLDGCNEGLRTISKAEIGNTK